ncbi:MAG: hypothetical protein ACLU62_13735 [Hydrogeniiclostridium sp.]
MNREDIETIIEHSLPTANSDNLTNYSVIIVDDPETLQKIILDKELLQCYF